jgi:hypothetical protein
LEDGTAVVRVSSAAVSIRAFGPSVTTKRQNKKARIKVMPAMMRTTGQR